jgi:predicted RNase H-like HicB family nuclease
MSRSLIYPCDVTQLEDGRWRVTFPDVPGAMTEGSEPSETMNKAQVALWIGIGPLCERWSTLPFAVKAHREAANFGRIDGAERDEWRCPMILLWV